MKKIAFTLSLIIGGFLALSAQTELTFQINHRLGPNLFELEVPAKNNIGQDFTVTRLEYYISDISVIHDGGQETAFKNVWILVDATEETNVTLGNIDIQQVEGVRFFVGVGPDFNHLDPATYPADHPLAPQWPSMHWGWASGYRFIAFEGYGGSALNQLFQLHGLGDQNFFETFVDLSIPAVDGKLSISLDADYVRGLENITLENGLIVHGDNLEAREALENFSQYVFSPSEPLVAVNQSLLEEPLTLFPNPAIAGTPVFIDIRNIKIEDTRISINDLQGNEVYSLPCPTEGSQIEIPASLPAGLYVIQITRNNQLIKAEKLIIY